jgi:MYXO-CTERM domain-containing protein
VTIDQAGGQVDPTANTPIQFAVTFSEVVTGFTSADVSFAGSTVGGTLVAVVTGTGPAYTVSVSGMVGNGTVVASVVAAGAQDSAGQPNAASSSTDNQVTYNDPAPTVTVDQSGPQIDPTTVSPIRFTVVFSEAVTGFTGGDVSFAGSTAGGTLTASIQGSGPTYTVSVSGMTTHGNVVVSIPAGAVLDLFNQPNASSTSSDNSVAWIGQPASGKSDDGNDDEDCSTGVNSGPWALLVLVAAVSLGLRRRKA